MSGVSCFSRIAAARPDGPPPTITTSNSIASRGASSSAIFNSLPLSICSIQTLSAPDDLRGQTGEPSRTFNSELWSVGFVFARSLVAGRARIGALSGCRRSHAPARRVAPRRGTIWSGGGGGAERRPVRERRVGRDQQASRSASCRSSWKKAISARLPCRGRLTLATSGDAGQSRRVILCPPIGVHDGMAGIIERRALAACARLRHSLAHRRDPGRRPWVRQLSPAELWRCTGTLPVSPRPPSSRGWRPPAWRKRRSWRMPYTGCALIRWW